MIQNHFKRKLLRTLLANGFCLVTVAFLSCPLTTSAQVAEESDLIPKGNKAEQSDEQQLSIQGDEFPLHVPELPQRANTLAGLNAPTLERRLGKPDSITKSENENKVVWHYGSSMVILIDGKVIGWSDVGELKEKEGLEKLKETEPAEGEDPFGGDWKNPWTPSESNKKVDAIKDILEDGKP